MGMPDDNEKLLRKKSHRAITYFCNYSVLCTFVSLVYITYHMTQKTYLILILATAIVSYLFTILGPLSTDQSYYTISLLEWLDGRSYPGLMLYAVVTILSGLAFIIFAITDISSETKKSSSATLACSILFLISQVVSVAVAVSYENRYSIHGLALISILLSIGALILVILNRRPSYSSVAYNNVRPSGPYTGNVNTPIQASPYQPTYITTELTEKQKQKLIELKNLHSAGVISKETYEKRKQKILSHP